MTELRKSAFHTLIIAESIDISVKKMQVVYFKYQPETEIVCRAIFGDIVKLSSCESLSVVTAIKQFYFENDLDLQKMVMFTPKSDELLHFNICICMTFTNAAH